jgi:hypothetical protein
LIAPSIIFMPARGRVKRCPHFLHASFTLPSIPAAATISKESFPHKKQEPNLLGIVMRLLSFDCVALQLVTPICPTPLKGDFSSEHFFMPHLLIPV